MHVLEYVHYLYCIKKILRDYVWVN